MHDAESEDWSERRSAHTHQNAREVVVGIVLPIAAMVITIAISAGALYDRMRSNYDDLRNRITVLAAKIDAHNLEAEYWKKVITDTSHEETGLKARLATIEADINAIRRETGTSVADCKEALKELRDDAKRKNR